MIEQHHEEQYFFDEPTLLHLAVFVSPFTHPCCLCTPLLGRKMVELGVRISLLDTDERFADLPGFEKFDLRNPHWLGQEFGLIICDPPFFNISLSQLFTAVRLLSRYNFDQPLLLCYLTRREPNLFRTFQRFKLRPTGYFPQYRTVARSERNEIQFYGNLPEDQHHKLRTLST